MLLVRVSWQEDTWLNCYKYKKRNCFSPTESSSQVTINNRHIKIVSLVWHPHTKTKSVYQTSPCLLRNKYTIVFLISQSFIVCFLQKLNIANTFFIDFHQHQAIFVLSCTGLFKFPVRSPVSIPVYFSYFWAYLSQQHYGRETGFYGIFKKTIG